MTSFTKRSENLITLSYIICTTCFFITNTASSFTFFVPHHYHGPTSRIIKSVEKEKTKTFSRRYDHHPSFNPFAGQSAEIITSSNSVESIVKQKNFSIMNNREIIASPPKGKQHAEATTKITDGLNFNKFLSNIQQSIHDMVTDESLTTVFTIPWKFQDKHSVFCQVSRPGISQLLFSTAKKLPVVVLVHGFGCSSLYWRETKAALLSKGYTVYSMDLLGHGRSDKPTQDIVYSTNLWARQLDDFCKDHLKEEENVVLVGNSMGSIISLLAATGEFNDENDRDSSSAKDHNSLGYIQRHITGIGMFNCGIGMNVHSITRHPKWNTAQRLVLDSIFHILESTIFSNVTLIQWILENIVTKDMLRKTLLQLYTSSGKNAKRIVNDELVESFYEPVASDPKASAQVLSKILTNDAGLTPMEVHAKYNDNVLKNIPIHVIWGKYDTVTPIDGIGEVAQFYSALAADDDTKRNRVSFDVVPGGHIPFDEVPDVANGSLLQWLEKLNTV